MSSILDDRIGDMGCQQWGNTIHIYPKEVKDVSFDSTWQILSHFDVVYSLFFVMLTVNDEQIIFRGLTFLTVDLLFVLIG